MKTRFVYLERSPKLAGKARQFGASYRRMMVLELEHDAEIPPAVKPGARGLVRIVEERTESIGKTPASYGFRERARLRELADSLNASARPVEFPTEDVNLAAPNQQARGFILRPSLP